MTQVSFTSLKVATYDDMQIMGKEYKVVCSPSQLQQRVVGMLLDQRGVFGGAQVDLFQHGLQTATRAFKNGEDEEMVILGLLHDIGELYCPQNHGPVAASLLRPYITDEREWILRHHDLFQAYYYLHCYGGNRNIRDEYKEKCPELYEATVNYCEEYDAPSFDPGYKAMELKDFEGMLTDFFSTASFSKSHVPETNVRKKLVTGNYR